MRSEDKDMRGEKAGKRTCFSAWLPFIFLGVISVTLSGCSESTYDISGRVKAGGAALSGVSVTLAGGGGSKTTSTDTDGNYLFTDVGSGTFSVTPSLAGYMFTPASRSAWIYGMSATGFDFWASLFGRVAATTQTIRIKSDATVWAWGENSNGQLGDGTTIDKQIPQQVAGLAVTAVAAGTNHTVALRKDGTVWTWGNNASGQLGDGTTTNRLEIGRASCRVTV